MKNSISLFLLFAFFALVLFACNDDDKMGNPIVENPEEEMEVIDTIMEVIDTTDNSGNNGGGIEPLVCDSTNAPDNVYSDYFLYEIGEVLYFNTPDSAFAEKVVFKTKNENISVANVGHYGESWETCAKNVYVEYEFDWVEGYILGLGLSTFNSGANGQTITTSTDDFYWELYSPFGDEYHEEYMVNGELLSNVAIYCSISNAPQEYISKVMVQDDVGLVGYERDGHWWILQ